MYCLLEEIWSEGVGGDFVLVDVGGDFLYVFIGLFLCWGGVLVWFDGVGVVWVDCVWFVGGGGGFFFEGVVEFICGVLVIDWFDDFDYLVWEGFVFFEVVVDFEGVDVVFEGFFLVGEGGVVGVLEVVGVMEWERVGVGVVELVYGGVFDEFGLGELLFLGWLLVVVEGVNWFGFFGFR